MKTMNTTEATMKTNKKGWSIISDPATGEVLFEGDLSQLDITPAMSKTRLTIKPLIGKIKDRLTKTKDDIGYIANGVKETSLMRVDKLTDVLTEGKLTKEEIKALRGKTIAVNVITGTGGAVIGIIYGRGIFSTALLSVGSYLTLSMLAFPIYKGTLTKK